MVSQILMGVYNVCRMMCMICVGERSFHWMVKERKRFALVGILYAVNYVFWWNGNFPISTLYFLGEFIVWSLLCEGKIRSKLGKMLVIYFGVDVLESMARTLLGFVFETRLEEEMIRLLGIMGLLVILMVITSQNWYVRMIIKVQSLSKMQAIAIIILVITGSAVAAVGVVVQREVKSLKFTLFFSIVIAISLCATVAIVIWLVSEKYQKNYYLEQNRLKEEILHTQQEFYQTIYEKDQEMRRFRHDIANQMGLLQMFLEKGQVNQAKEQLSQIHQEFEQANFQKVSIGEEVLDAILSMMNQKAFDIGVPLEIKGEVKNWSHYNIYELCTIFSNAIKNALEACEQMSDTGMISVKVLEHSNSLCCTFENSATPQMYEAVLKQKTTKVDTKEHGYGVANIRRAVERLQGSMEYSYGNGRIKLEIFI